MGDKPKEERRTYYCSFCGKSQHDVLNLIASPRAFICNECTDLCAEVCDEARAEKAAKSIIAKTLKVKRSIKRVLSARFWGGGDG
ncbi:hypothetical protein GOB83_13810 [Acetobacter fabarum]|nr:ClpX C4-type zinc finger protein [Acetobacter fabarum]NHO43230.1 hypothetical protein [Acetobacter fabarum]